MPQTQAHHGQLIGGGRMNWVTGICGVCVLRSVLFVQRLGPYARPVPNRLLKPLSICLVPVCPVDVQRDIDQAVALPQKGLW